MWIKFLVFSTILIKHIIYSKCNIKPTEPTGWTLHYNVGYYYLESNSNYRGDETDNVCPTGTTRFYIKTVQDYLDYIDFRSEYNWIPYNLENSMTCITTQPQIYSFTSLSNKVVQQNSCLFSKFVFQISQEVTILFGLMHILIHMMEKCLETANVQLAMIIVTTLLNIMMGLCLIYH